MEMQAEFVVAANDVVSLQMNSSSLVRIECNGLKLLRVKKLNMNPYKYI